MAISTEPLELISATTTVLSIYLFIFADGMHNEKGAAGLTIVEC
jgi:hypothetical protein